jgi:hypothetical protein
MKPWSLASALLALPASPATGGTDTLSGTAGQPGGAQTADLAITQTDTPDPVAPNNSVLILQNRTPEPLTFRPYFWNDAGGDIYSHIFVELPPKGTWVFVTTGAKELRGKSGSISILPWGGYDALAGKSVSVEPSTGDSFDSLVVSRPR